MARITALAKAMQAAGNGGQIDFVRAQVFLGLILGTMPYIPPPGEPPPDEPPPHDLPGNALPSDDLPSDDLPSDDLPGGMPPAGNAERPAGLTGPSWPWPGVLPYLPQGPGA